MPLYTYRCNDCDHEFEVRQRMTEDPLSICPVCGGNIRRVVSSVGVVFKGSGFYVTDNRSSSVNGSSSRSSSASKTTESSSESSSEKPKTTSEASSNAKSSASTAD